LLFDQLHRSVVHFRTKATSSVFDTATLAKKWSSMHSCALTCFRINREKCTFLLIYDFNKLREIISPVGNEQKIEWKIILRPRELPQIFANELQLKFQNKTAAFKLYAANKKKYLKILLLTYDAFSHKVRKSFSEFYERLKRL
jgi:hypothetical protein